MRSASDAAATGDALAAAMPLTMQKLESSHILVVDDSHMVRAMIGAYLTGAGFHHIDYAGDGVEALARIAARRPDLIILDDEIPDPDGLEICRRLRADPATRDLPVLVQATATSPERRTEAFDAGASDVLNKPVNREELLARARIQLETGHLIRSLQLFQQRVDSELAMARESYQHLLPAPAHIGRLQDRCGLTIHWHAALSPDTGGDICGLLDLPGRRAGLYVLDVVGRGVSAALNTITLHTLIGELSCPGNDPAVCLTGLNRQTLPLFGAEQHAALLCGFVDPDNDRFLYATAAGAAPVVLVDGAFEIGPPTGPPIGLRSDAAYECRCLPFPPGADLFLFTDGVLRAFADAKQPEVAFAELAKACLGSPKTARRCGFQRLIERLSDLLGETLEDDLALLHVSRRSDPS